MTIENFNNILLAISGKALKDKEKESIWETFKII
jgi:hypothetical protein